MDGDFNLVVGTQVTLRFNDLDPQSDHIAFGLGLRDAYLAPLEEALVWDMLGLELLPNIA